MSIAAVFAGSAPAAFAQAAQDAQAAEAQGFSAAKIDGQTEVDKAIGRCVLSVAGGALVGALIGGRRNAGQGALIGAGVGVGICAVMMKFASDSDRRRLRELQLRALNTGADQEEAWQTSNGRARATVTTTKVVEVMAPKLQEPLKCRRANTRITVDNQSQESSDIVCLNGDSWVTLDKLKPTGITASEIGI